jgi:hypothetical protein
MSSMKRKQDWVCPTACGECCFEPQMRACRPLQRNGMCKHYTKKGCALPREKRPWQCNHYLCPHVAHETPEYLDIVYGSDWQ